MDRRDLGIMAEVRRGCVARVHGKQLSLDERRQIPYPLHAHNVWVFEVRLPRGLLDNPFEKGFDGDVEAGVGVLTGDDTVDGAVGEAGTLFDCAGVFRGHVFGVGDEVVEGCGGANGILAGDYRQRFRFGAGIDGFGDYGGDEFEDVGANGAGDLVREGLVLRERMGY